MSQQVSTIGKWLTVVALALITVMVMPAKPAYAATLTVNSTGDQSDASPGNGVCQTPFGTCTLRAAIQEANALSGVDTISFSIGSGAQTIYPASMLPDITQPVYILGTTQPGYSGTPLIRLDGNNLVWDGIRLKPGSNGSMIQALMIVRFKASGIYIDHCDAQMIMRNYIGTDGTTALGNRAGIYVSGGTNTIIGGIYSGTGNLISGNNYEGIQLVNGTTGVQIYGNLIGTNAAGTSAIGNEYGIKIDNSPNNSVGSTLPGSGNVISGNDEGMFLRNNTSGTLIQGNLIGANAAGTAALGNSNIGIRIDNAHNNTVGGTMTAARNIISGNPSYGIYVLNGASGNMFKGNYFGSDITGTVDITPAVYFPYGIVVYGGPNTVIGGSTLAERNLFLGLYTGIQLVYAQTAGSTVQNNSFGMRSDGVFDPNLSNEQNIMLYGTNNITIGGDSSQANDLYGGDTSMFVQDSTNISLMGNRFSAFNYGVVLYGGSNIRAYQNIFAYGDQAALWLQANASLQAGSTFNCFVDNTNEAVRSDNPTTQVFENNWWHAASGPSGSGYSGQGEGIVGAVDASPWLTSPLEGANFSCAPYYATVLNPSFEQGSGSSATSWTANSGERVCDVAYSGSCSYRFVSNGLVVGSRYVEQTIPATIGHKIVVSANSKALNVPTIALYRITVIVNYFDGTYDMCEASYTTGTHNWETRGCELTATKEVATAKLRLEYNASSGTVWFDNVFTYVFPE